MKGRISKCDTESENCFHSRLICRCFCTAYNLLALRRGLICLRLDKTENKKYTNILQYAKIHTSICIKTARGFCATIQKVNLPEKTFQKSVTFCYHFATYIIEG